MSAFKSFVSETELDEKRQKRQEEWEKVRTAEEPEECPEEEHDNRSLYDRLQEQKDKKQATFDEQHQFKNMVRGLDDDESSFLDEVAVRQMELEKRKQNEEKEILKEVEEYKDRVFALDEPTSSSKPTTQEKKKLSDAAGTSKKKSQASLLAGAVKRKKSSTAEESVAKKPKPDSPDQTTPLSPPTSTTTHSASHQESTPMDSNGTVHKSNEQPTRAQVVAVLPGLGHYQNSDDSDTSESASDDDLDLTGPLVRQPVIKKKVQSH